METLTELDEMTELENLPEAEEPAAFGVEPDLAVEPAFGSFENENRLPRVGGHTTVHTAAIEDFGVEPGFDLSAFDPNDYYVPTQAMYDLSHQPIEAIETVGSHGGPPKWAGRLAVLFGLALLALATFAAINSVTGLLHNPLPTIAAATDTDDDLTDLVVEEQTEGAAEETGPVTTAYAVTGSRIRTAPSQTAETIGSITAGDAVEITGDAQDGWYPVRYEGMEGWTWGQLLTGFQTVGADGTVEAEAPISEMRTLLRTVHLRSGPQHSQREPGFIQVGSQVEVTGPVQAGGWVPIIYDGQAGYVIAQNLR